MLELTDIYVDSKTRGIIAFQSFLAKFVDEMEWKKWIKKTRGKLHSKNFS